MCFLCKNKESNFKESNFNEPVVIRNSIQMVKTIEKIAEGMLPKHCEVICYYNNSNYVFNLKLKDHLCDLEVNGSFDIYMNSCDEGYYYDIISNALDLLPKMKEELNKKREKKFINMMKEKDCKKEPETNSFTNPIETLSLYELTRLY
jgi:hypothetical protein